MKNRRKIEFLDTIDQYYMRAGTSGTREEEPGLMLDFCGLEHCRPLHSYGPNIRNNYVLHIVCEGKGVLYYQNRVWSVEPGQMLLLFPGEVAKYRADRANPWFYCWVGFHGKLAGKVTEKIGFSPESPVLPVGDPAEAETVIEDMLQTKEMEAGGKLRRNAKLLTLLADLIENKPEKEEAGAADGDSFSYVEYAIQYINNHFMDKLRVLELAERIGISRSYLVKLMHRETGMSPQEYLIEVRMRRAREILLRTEDPIREIAAECGYEDPLSFSKSFKSRHGLSPSEYRKKYRNQHESAWMRHRSMVEGQSER